MLFFNWINLVKESGGDPLKTVSILRNLLDNKISKIGLKQKLKGNSFLINPKPLLNEKSIDILYIYQYLTLAARRDYSLHRLYGKSTLPLSYFPDIDRSAIVHNPLLTIKNDEIHFLYEELK